MKMSVSVPSTFSAVMLITNMGWDLQLTNRDSDLFQLLAREIQQNILAILQPGPELAVKGDMSRLCSHWSSSYITALSLVEILLVMLRQLSYAIKNQLKAAKAPY